MKAIKLGLQSVIEQLTDPKWEQFCWDNLHKDTLLGVALDEVEFWEGGSTFVTETTCGKEWVISGDNGLRTFGEVQVLEFIISEIHEDVIKNLYKI